MLCSCAYSPPINTATYIIEDAAQTLERFSLSPQLSGYQQVLESAPGVFILPALIPHNADIMEKNKTIDVGTGISIARASDNIWSGPSFHNLSLEAGNALYNVDDAGSFIIIFKSQEVMDDVLIRNRRFGGVAGVQYLLISDRRKPTADEMNNAAALIYTDGQYAGLSGTPFDNSHLPEESEFNEWVYGEGAKPQTILKSEIGEPATNHYPSITRRLKRALGP